MKQYIFTLILVTLLALGAGTVYTIAQRDTSPSELRVATTIFPLADITKQIAEDHVQVVQLLPGGASPHVHTLTPQQLRDLEQSHVLFAIGHGLDDWATKAAADATSVEVVLTDNNIDLKTFGENHHHGHDEPVHGHDEHNDHGHDEPVHGHDEHGHVRGDHHDHGHDEPVHGHDEHGHDHSPGSIDPHYWLTVPNAQNIATTIADTLKEIDPDNSEVYEQNLATYLKELDALEEELQAQATQATQKDFIAIHDAWSYFTDHYGLNLVATYEPVEGREPSASDIRRLQNLVREHNITAFYTEPQKESISAVRFIREDIGLEIRTLDPIGDTEDRTSFIELMRTNMNAIVE